LRTFLLAKNPKAAAQAVEAILKAIQSLDIFPERGKPVGPSGLRELFVVFGRSSYVLRYRRLADRDSVVVLRIRHGREAQF
jgi:toxin ParE1/3/4